MKSGNSKQFEEDSGVIDVSKLRMRLSTMSETVYEFLLILDGKGTIKFANSDFCRFLGQDVQTVSGRFFSDFWIGEAKTRVGHLVHSCLESKKELQESLPIGLDVSRQRVFKWTFTGILEESGKIEQIVVTGRDVSTEHVAEHLIREQERQLRTVMANLPGMVYRCQDDEYMTPLFISEGALKLTGYSPEDLVDNRRRVFFELIHPGDSERVRTLIRTAVENHLPYEFIYRLVQRNGSLRWVWEQGTAVYKHNGQVRYLEGIIMDVTVQKQNEDARNRLTTAIDQASEGVLITDERGNIIYLNAALARDIGLESDFLLNRSIIRLSSLPTNNELLAHLRSALEGGEAWRGEVTAGPDLKVKNRLMITVSPVFNDESQLIHVVLITRNISKEKDLEDQLRQAQKMEAIGQLAGGVAHDFNNLLQVILSYTELLLEDENNSEGTNSNLNHVYNATLRARDLVLQLLAFGRRQLLEPINLNLNQLIEKMVSILPRVLGESIRISFTANEVHTVMADPGALEQVLMNLFINARDALPQGGDIDIKLDWELIEEPPENEQDLETGLYTRLIVRDNGIGMSPEIMDRIFEPFFTTKEVGDGSGLGLSTAYGIIKQHKGKIRVASEPGKGTTFWIYLKASDGMKEIQEVVTPVAEKSAMVIGPVLIVEDDAMVRKLMQLVFKKLNIEIDLAGTFFEGITCLKQHEWDYELVICDLELPDGRGSDLLTQVRLNNSRPKLLLMTGFMDDADNRDLLYDYLLKPFSIKTLTERIETLLNR